MDGDLIPQDDDARKQWLKDTATEAEALRQCHHHLEQAWEAAKHLPLPKFSALFVRIQELHHYINDETP